MSAVIPSPAVVEGRPDLNRRFGTSGKLGFTVAVAIAVLYVGYSIYSDASSAGVRDTAILPFALLFVALMIALAFEFVNGFHDTADAVAMPWSHSPWGTVLAACAAAGSAASVYVWLGRQGFLGNR